MRDTTKGSWKGARYLLSEGAVVSLQEGALQGGSLAFEKISQHLLCVRE